MIFPKKIKNHAIFWHFVGFFENINILFIADIYFGNDSPFLGR